MNKQNLSSQLFLNSIELIFVEVEWVFIFDINARLDCFIEFTSNPLSHFSKKRKSVKFRVGLLPNKRDTKIILFLLFLVFIYLFSYRIKHN